MVLPVLDVAVWDMSGVGSGSRLRCGRQTQDLHVVEVHLILVDGETSAAGEHAIAKTEQPFDRFVATVHGNVHSRQMAQQIISSIHIPIRPHRPGWGNPPRPTAYTLFIRETHPDPISFVLRGSKQSPHS